jgi:hypothetical protein
MLRHSRLLVGCLGAALALGSFIIGLEVSATSAALSIETTAETTAPAVNRALKGDRLPLVHRGNRNTMNGPLEIKAPPAPAKPKLLDGCEPVVSSIGQSPLAQVPGRCLS